MRGCWLVGLWTLASYAQSPPPGRVIEDQKCAAAASQSYALYLPSNYSPDRAWPLILAFDPRARGKAPVEIFRTAAETYGYIVAGSNNSRNGSWEVSIAAVNAMTTDLDARFRIDEKRVYTAGLSGGARVAMQMALGSGRIAGVIASSAGFPDSVPRTTVPFAVFGTAGTEDFNYLEMRLLDRTLTSPHHVAIFEGGHTWLSSELAVEAVEWLELQAMKSGRRAHDGALIETLFAKRSALASAQTGEKECFLAASALAADFNGLRNVPEFTAREQALKQSKAVKDAIRKDRAEEQREERLMSEIGEIEAGIQNQERHAASLLRMQDRLAELARKSEAAKDSPDRRMARRVLRGALMGAAERVKDPEYRKLIDKYRPSFGRP